MAEADVVDYVKLREEVKQLKIERQECVRLQHAKKMLSERALAEIRVEYEDTHRAREREIARLKKSVQDSTQRESRQRARFDKEVKSLELQLRKATSAMEEEKAAHKEMQQQLRSEKEEAVRKHARLLKDQFRARQKERDVKIAQWLTETKEKCESVRSSQERRLNAIANAVAAISQEASKHHSDWLRKLKGTQHRIHQMNSNAEESQSNFRNIRDVIQKLRWRRRQQDQEKRKEEQKCEELEEDIKTRQEQYKRQVKETEEGHVRKIAEIQLQHTCELESIQSHVEQVLRNKEQTIVDLTQKIHALKELLHTQDATILAFDQDVHSTALL